MIHPFKDTDIRNLRNYNIEPLEEGSEHAFYSPSESISKCKGNNMKFGNITYYREYFDVKNVPIKEKFHLGIVINEKLVEIYINGELVTSQVLFGEPKYNSGPLHISPGIKDNGKDLKLNGIITDFKYYNKAINYNNIKNIMTEKPVIQTEENINVEQNIKENFYIEN